MPMSINRPSPLGASVGGPALASGLRASQVAAIVEALQRYAVSQGWGGLEFTLAPSAWATAKMPSPTLQSASDQKLFGGGNNMTRRLAALAAAGLLAASLGLSRMYADDLAQLEAGMTLYDAFYRWCRDATEETHTLHSKKRGA